jgi:hypothetical protein
MELCGLGSAPGRRHCERSEAIHRAARGDMDCFVAALLAMTTRQKSTFSRHFMPESCVNRPSKDRGRRESRMRVAPAASCARSEMQKAHEQYRYAETFRPSLRNGFTAYGALSSASGLDSRRHPASVSQSLISASGDQDHTLSPSAPIVARPAIPRRPPRPARRP